MGYSESKIISNNYLSHSLSLVKISSQTVKVLLSTGVKIVGNQHKNQIIDGCEDEVG
jgi:hypothetical protein